MTKSEDDRSATFKGSCLCGAVTQWLRHESPSVSACHCRICRRWTGGPFMTIETHEPPEISGAEHVRSYASSSWAERGFCGHCGTHLFYRLTEGRLYSLPVGLFDSAGQWPFKLQIFVDEKPDNYEFANVTREMTGEEVFRQWPPES